jgi:hypothetical protein
MPEPPPVTANNPGFVAQRPSVVHEDDSLVGPNSYQVGDTEKTDIPLSRVVASTNNTALADETMYCKYNASLNTSAKVAGVEETSIKNMQYNIGVRSARGNINVWDVQTPSVTGDVVVPESLQKDVSYSAKRNPALPSSFKTMNLLGIVERLASGLAHYASWGELNTLELRGGRNWDVRSVQALI